jgi:hypothetical protein
MPTTSVGALTRTEGAPTGRPLSDMSDEERRALAAIVAQPRARLADAVVALRGPLAIFATSVVAGIGGVWAALRFPDVNRLPIAPIAAIIAVGLCSSAFAFLLLSARRHGRLASVVAFLAERGFSPRSQQAAVIHLQRFERRLGVPPSADNVLRFLEHLQKAQGGRADAVPLSVLDGIARALVTPPGRFLALLPYLSAPSVVFKSAAHFSPLVVGALAGTFLACLTTTYVLLRRPRRPSRQLLAPLELGLAAAEEDRLIRAFDAALQQTSRQRRKLAYALPVQLLVAQVKELLARDAVPGSALDEARRRVLGEGEVALPAFSDTSSQPVVAEVEVGARGKR